MSELKRKQTEDESPIVEPCLRSPEDTTEHKRRRSLCSEDGSDIEVDEHQKLKPGQPFDAIQYLFPCYETDYLIRKNKDGTEERVTADCLVGKRYVVICTFHIPVMYEIESNAICRDLQVVFGELAKEHFDFEVVLVTRMRSDCPDSNLAAFDQFFSAFSPTCLAVPISDTFRSFNLFRLIGSSYHSYPGCIVADLEKRELSYTSIDSFQEYGLDFYPFTEMKVQELHKQETTIYNGNMPLATLLRRQSSDVLNCVRHSGSCGKKELLSNLTNKVVLLYHLYDGKFIRKFRELYKQCKAKEHEFAVVVMISANSYHKEDQFRSLLRRRDCCGWFYVPFDYTISCRLRALGSYSCDDKLVVFGPNGSYTDPDGKEVYLDYGIGAYPFTKQAVWDMEVAKLRGSTLKYWLSCCKIRSVSRDGQRSRVSSLEGANVLVCFDWAPLNPHPDAWQSRLLRWIDEMKASSTRRLEVLFVCTYVDAKTVPSLDKYCSDLGWFLPCPHDIVQNDALVDVLFGKTGVYGGRLVAFDGSSGRLLRVSLERTLLAQSGPATFPESDDELRTDVGLRLNSLLGDNTWWGALKI